MSEKKIDEFKSNEDYQIPGIGGLNPDRNIKVEVCNPVIRDEKLGKYIVYTVKGSDREGKFEVIRRYSDFDKIRTLLVIRWPGCYIPSIPSKKSKNFEAKVVLKRRRYLDLFVKLIAELPYLHYSEEYQLFIRSYGLDLEKAFAPMAKFSYDDLISKYSSCFNHLSGKELSDKTVMKIAKFKTFKQNIDAILNNFKKLTKKAALARRTYYETFAQLHSQVCLEYEQNVLKGYHNNTPSKNVFTDLNNVAVKKSADKIRESAQIPSWEFLYESLKVESREIEALMEAINQRDKYGSMKIKAQEKQKNTTLELQKILAGKTTIKSFFSRKSIEEEVSTLEGQISKDEKELEELSMVHDMITLIIAYDEIEKFKKSRLNVYHNTVKAIAQAEIKQVENISNYWDGVMKHEDLNSDNEI